MSESGKSAGSKAVKGLALLAGTLLAGGLFWWAWRQVDTSTWLSLWKTVPLWAWGMASLLWSVSFLLRARRMQQEWCWKRRVSWYETLRVVLLHNAAVLLLPLRSGELGYPWLVRQVYGASWRDAMRSLMWLRMQDAVVLGTLALLLWPGLPFAWRLLALPGLALIVMPAVLWRRLLSLRYRWLVRRFPWMRRRGISGGWWLSLVNWLIKITVVAGLLHAMTGDSVGLGGLQALSAALGGELAALIPVQGPAGLGTYEAGVWFASGVPTSAAPLLGLAALQVHGFCLAVSLGLAGVWSLLGLNTPSHQAKAHH